MRQVVEIDSCC